MALRPVVSEALEKKHGWRRFPGGKVQHLMSLTDGNRYKTACGMLVYAAFVFVKDNQRRCRRCGKGE